VPSDIGLIHDHNVAWYSLRDEVKTATRDLAWAASRADLEAIWMRLLRAGDRCADFVRSWVASALELEPVREPKILLSLDVDGVLEEDVGVCSATGLIGAAALKLLQLGRVGVVLNTARSMHSVQARVATFQLLGGVAGFGGGTWDAVYGREQNLVSSAGIMELWRLSRELGMNGATVLDHDHQLCLRASWITDGLPAPIAGTAARRLLDHLGLDRLTYWVAPRHTDFVDRGVDKWKGLIHLQDQLGLMGLPLAAMGDSACDLPMLRKASLAFLPAATLPSYVPPPKQKLVRSRYLGQHALWEAARNLVPNASLQAKVRAMVNSIHSPEWLPHELRATPLQGSGIRSRFATALAVVRKDG
jgi:hypothetical protein